MPTGQAASLDMTVRRAPRTRGFGERQLVGLCVAPAVIVVAGSFGLVIVMAVIVSLSNWQGAGPVVIAGIQHYSVLLHSPAFYRSLLLTVGYALGTAVGTVAVATLLAAAVSRNVRGSRFYRVVWFIPGVAPPAAVAVFWATAFQPTLGTVNALLGYLGLGSNTAWLASPHAAIYPITFVSIWAGVGFSFILLLGAMEQIPVSLYEAAQIDGASATRQFFSLTLPLARSVLAIVGTLNLISAFNNFTTIWGMTEGGPGSATTTLPVLVYKDAFINGNYGTGTAVAVIAGVVLLAMGFVSLRISQTRERREAS